LVSNRLLASQADSEQYTPSLSDNKGYVKLDNGLIIQYGFLPKIYYDEEHYEQVDFPIPFPNKCVTVLASCNQNEYYGGMRQAYVVSFDKNKATFLPGQVDKSIYAGLTWMAIGF